MSQLPNLEAAWWASAIGAAMSLGYSTIAIALGAAEAKNGLGSLTGDTCGVAVRLGSQCFCSAGLGAGRGDMTNSFAHACLRNQAALPRLWIRCLVSSMHLATLALHTGAC